MSSPKRYDTIPREDAGIHSDAGSSVQQQTAESVGRVSNQGFYAKFHDWWSSSRTENAPLLNRRRMTLEAPRKNLFRVFIEIVVIVGIFTLIATIILMVAGTSEQTGGISLKQI